MLGGRMIVGDTYNTYYESQHTTVLGIRKRILCNILQLETHIPAGGS